MRRLIAASLIALLPHTAVALETSGGPVEIQPVVQGLEGAWGLAFMPGGGFLFTLKSGELRHVTGAGEMRKVRGVPRVNDNRQGGLLDVMVPRDFATTREIYLSYSKPQRGGSGTALAAGRLSAAGDRLEDVRVIFEMERGTSGGRHFGSRIVEAPDGTLFLTIGDRGDREGAQDLSIENGTVVRINRDGSVPGDNPFVDVAGAQPEIWTYGHRNPQGAALDLAGNLWTVEHGARGGDEINRINAGANYGWPVISYGTHYSGAKIGEGTRKDGMVQPAFYWDPSMAPSGMMIYSGALWPEWRGDIFVGSLKFNYISRLGGTPLREAEKIESDETLRVRDVREAPDGSIWFISEGQGTIYRMIPEGSAG